MRVKPDLSFRRLWDISFGFFGVQIAYALQSANISRIFATLGADPHNLSYFWILPPLAGIIVQPIVGALSDRTWNRFGRRIPYLIAGSAIAVAVMCLLPNAASFKGYIHAMWFGLIALMMLDTSINMAMQPFKMLVGDMVNERQKGLAYSIQSFLSNAGSLVSNIAAPGVIPDSVIFSFYGGAAILILCTLYSSIRVKEMPPAEFRKFHQISDKELTEKNNFISLLRHAPKVFWTVGLVQFFCWSAFMYMWTYSTGAIADNVWHSTDPASPGYQSAGNWTGVLFAIQAIGSVCWAPLLPLIKNRKAAYSLSLLIGGAGFTLVPFIHNAYLMFLPFFLIGCAWAAILALPFTILTNSISGKNMGAYLGLFNGTICVPQILAALVGGSLLRWLGGSQPVMLGISGILLFAGALCVFAIKETFAHESETERIEKGD
mgnify:CR=1 FL=1